MSGANDRTLGVALSGGGYRAAAFSLGVLLYLVDAGHNKAVATIASVSGGSMTNAFVALEGGYATADPGGYRKQVEPLASRLAHETIISRRSLIALRAGLPIFLAVMALLFAVVIFGEVPRFWIALSVFAVVSVIYVIALLVGDWMIRAYVVRDHVRGMLREVAATRDLELSLLGASDPDSRPPIEHVICATDLAGGTHAYFTKDGVVIRSLDPSAAPLPTQARVDKAVAASAAFPGAFHPIAVRVRLKDGSKAKLWLVDGGVRDNLGLSWFDPLPDLSCQIVVNAAAATRRLGPMIRSPVLGEYVSLARSVDITHRSNTEARLKQTKRGWTESNGVTGVAIELAPQGADASTPQDDDAARDRMVATGLERLGQKQAARLIHRGYEEAMRLTGADLSWSEPPDGAVLTLEDCFELCGPDKPAVWASLAGTAREIAETIAAPFRSQHPEDKSDDGGSAERDGEI